MASLPEHAHRSAAGDPPFTPRPAGATPGPVVGDVVRYGIRLGRVVRLERQGGRDGALVTPETIGPGDGYLPHWIPLSGLTVYREVR